MALMSRRIAACARSAAFACALLVVAGSACTVPGPGGASTALVQQTRLSDRLYFGRMRASGIVTEAEWAQFLAEEVTPRFPDGLTVWGADGQWRDGAQRVIVREPTFVLEVVHTRAGSRDADIEAIVTAYKKRFAQQSVLWIRDRVTVMNSL